MFVLILTLLFSQTGPSEYADAQMLHIEGFTSERSCLDARLDWLHALEKNDMQGYVQGFAVCVKQ